MVAPATEQQIAAYQQRIHDLVSDPTVPEIHVSDIGAFLQCRRQWNWTSEHRGNLEPKRPYMPFLTGRAVHLCIERFLAYGEKHADVLPGFLSDELDQVRYRELTPEEKAQREALGVVTDDEDRVETDLWAEIEPQVAEQMELVRGMMDHYYEWEDNQKGPFSYRNLEVITMEQAFRVPILHHATKPADFGSIEKWHPFDKAVFAGRLDGIVRRRDTGQVYIREDKTTRAIPSRVRLLANEYQPTGYSYAFRLMFPELASKFSGVMYTLISKRVPKMPKVLVNGMLSQDVKDQSFESFVRAIEIHHGEAATNDFIAAHYGPTVMALHKSGNSGNTFFERHIVNRSDVAINQWQEYMTNFASNMLSPDLPVYPTPGYHCSYCFMNEPCISFQNHGQAITDMILQDNYRQRPPRTVEAESED